VALARSDLEAVAPLMTPAEFGASSSAQAHPVTATAAEDRRILAAFDEYRCKATAGRIRWYAFRDAVLPLLADPSAAVIAELERLTQELQADAVGEWKPIKVIRDRIRELRGQGGEEER
jgi:hypothetical protein